MSCTPSLKNSFFSELRFANGSTATDFPLTASADFSAWDGRVPAPAFGAAVGASAGGPRQTGTPITAAARSRRKLPSQRDGMFAEITARNSAPSRIWVLIFVSHESPLRRSPRSNHTAHPSMPAARKAATTRSTAALSSRT